MYHLDRQRISNMNDYDEDGNNEYELQEIGMQQCLDMLHCTLIHDLQNTTTDDLTEFAKHLLKAPAPNDDDVEYSYSGQRHSIVAGTSNASMVKVQSSSTSMSPGTVPAGNSTVAMVKLSSTSYSTSPGPPKISTLSLQPYDSNRSNQGVNQTGNIFSGNNGMKHMALASTSSIRSNYNDGLHSPLSPGSTDRMLPQTLVHGPSSPMSPIIPIPKSPQRVDPESPTQDLFSFGFGVRFSYWVPEWPDFVSPQFSDLRSELLENDLYQITPLQWDLLQHRANMFKRTNHWRCIFKAQHRGSGNVLMKIAAGSHLSTQHLIALFSYATYPNLRLSFQKACLRNTATETVIQVRRRHQQIAHWARLLYEAVYLFGTRMTDNQSFYHILRSKIMLREFSVNLSCPTTMIANRRIVSHSDIVMQVKSL